MGRHRLDRGEVRLLRGDAPQLGGSCWIPHIENLRHSGSIGHLDWLAAGEASEICGFTRHALSLEPRVESEIRAPNVVTLKIADLAPAAREPAEVLLLGGDDFPMPPAPRLSESPDPREVGATPEGSVNVAR